MTITKNCAATELMKWTTISKICLNVSTNNCKILPSYEIIKKAYTMITKWWKYNSRQYFCLTAHRIYLLVPCVRFTKVLPIWRVANIEGAFTSYQSLRVNGSTLKSNIKWISKIVSSIWYMYVIIQMKIHTFDSDLLKYCLRFNFCWLAHTSSYERQYEIKLQTIKCYTQHIRKYIHSYKSLITV